MGEKPNWWQSAMTRIAISVEGLTELYFVEQILQPYFNPKGIYFFPVNIGGNVSVDKAISNINRLASNHDFVTSLYDFYGFKKRGDKTIEQLLSELKAKVKPEYADKFIPYIQLYEFEALLFSSPEKLATGLGDSSKSEELRKIVEKADGAENINDGFDTCPSRRIEKHFPAFDKLLHAPTICKDIGIDVIKQNCPRFASWIAELEALKP